MFLPKFRQLSPKLIISLAIITASLIIIFSYFLSPSSLYNLSSLFIKKTKAPTITTVPTISPNPTPTPVSPEELERLTKDWTTYTDPVLGFSFRYPENRYRVSEDNTSLFGERYGFGGNLDNDFQKRNGYNPPTLVRAVTIFTNKKYQSRYGEYTAEPFRVWVYSNPFRLSLMEWYRKYNYYPFGYGYYFGDDENRKLPNTIVTIGGLTGRKYSDAQNIISNTLVPNEELIYFFNLLTFSPIGEEFPVAVDANLILSTFKFPNK